jgi:hypothetical protein
VQYQSEKDKKKRKKKNERGGGIIRIISPKNLINHLTNYCKNINIVVVVEWKNTDFRWSKRDGPLWAVHIKKILVLLIFLILLVLAIRNYRLVQFGSQAYTLFGAYGPKRQYMDESQLKYFQGINLSYPYLK